MLPWIHVRACYNRGTRHTNEAMRGAVQIVQHYRVQIEPGGRLGRWNPYERIL